MVHILFEKNNKNIKVEIKPKEVDENNKDKNIVNLLQIYLILAEYIYYF